MPESGVKSMSHEEILSFEEILRLTRIFGELGVTKFKITGGEPLVRRGVADLIAQMKILPETEQVTLTTNGMLLADYIRRLEDAGLDAVNISLDTLNPAKFREISRIGDLSAVLSGIEAAIRSDIPKVKINCVPMEGFNSDELVEIARLAEHSPLIIRFIEMMPIGEGAGFPPIDNGEVKKRLEEKLGAMEEISSHMYGNGPAVYFQPKGFIGKIGLISAVSHAFCKECNRVRLTADGFLKLCLYYKDGIDLRALLRNGSSDAEIREAIVGAINSKPLHHDFGHEEQHNNIEEGRMSRIGG
jgi:cyclic pyranopterin phosphate synthase